MGERDKREAEAKHYQAKEGRLVAWVTQLLTNGAKDGHRYTKSGNVRIADIYFPGLRLPQDIAAKVRKTWADEWKSQDKVRVAEARTAMHKLRERVRDMPKRHLEDLFTGPSLREALRTFGTTSIGPDNVEPRVGLGP